MSLAWGGHANGRIPASALMRVPWAPSHMLERSACEALIEVNRGYRARFRVDIPMTDSYRPIAVQERIFRERYVLGVPQGTRDVRPYAGGLWYLRRGQSSAAVPGKSNHGWAKAIDAGRPINVFGTDEHDWMRNFAGDAGWVHPAWAHDGTSVGGTDEPWHFEYPTPVLVSRPVGPSLPRPVIIVAPPAPTPIAPKELDDMYGPEEHAEVMAAFRALTAQIASANATASAAETAAVAATRQAAAATEAAAAAERTAAAAVAVAREAVDAVGAESDELRGRIALVGRQLVDVKARMPRATTATYARPGARTYAAIGERAALDGLTYASLTLPRASLIGG